MSAKKFFLILIGIISGTAQVGILIFLLILPSISVDTIPDASSFKSSIEELIDKFNYKSNGFINEIIIYNGTTINEGIKSNDNINKKAIQLTKDASSDRERAEIIYEWVGSNIEYDDEKAEIVLSGVDRKEMPKSGAICAFDTGKGICFDKACLYVAMARASGLKVRLLSGEAFDGEKYVGHAWNQVYLKDENIWINVDTTFYDAGNYFDSNLFNEHKIENIAGEW
ncbi:MULTISPECIES: transglutaminase-like domain-containing protein [Clostridium]|uniref:Transglutaminase domain-containing protein n=1 Tax=Clostridium butyricum TaxID=1492 RepID=A0AAP9RDE8_CLOBU|nr:MULTISPECIES: transglutaminase-like domain-containing protein [Clostridium]ALP90092.1 transglutaminase [Clostridium butyricum]ALS16546.1 transglutaminase [Clostridium butyricum]ANF13710.1 transglutaminase [Clostridium butyricum]AOR93777.1 transglutaminase [Clostridium butyricum]AXB84402.1 transglutaminase domain-containing protein [Clostridium butyricum]